MDEPSMNLFIYEYITAGGLGPKTPPSLRTEGRAMLAALVEDFGHVPDVRTLTLLTPSAPKPLGDLCRHVKDGSEKNAFREMTALADMVMIIAPEFNDILAERSRWVLGAGKKLLGSSPAAIDLTADKYTLAQHFAKHCIATPSTFLVGSAEAAEQRCPFPALCKPRHGAGSQATFLVHDATQLATCWRQARTDMPGADFLLQPFSPGEPVSVTFLLGPKQRLALQPAMQLMSADGRFHYRGGRLPLPQSLAERAVTLARAALETVDGLAGMVGVDLVLGEKANGGDDVVIEINPRPTTSYVGLRQLAGDNLANALWRITLGEEVAPLRWRAGPVEFAVGC
jgi:predicted ATP-grasp superfamily ATP-dependent carboligase